jgi:long-subunit fatty acid transport protein
VDQPGQTDNFNKKQTMKRIIPLVILLLCSFGISAQSLSYVDQAVLFSTENNLGTARYMGMSGAFGALGNDMSAVDINPAGLAVYEGGEFSTTFTYRDTDIKSTFYGNSINNNDDYFRFAQIGGLSTFDSFGAPDIDKFAFGFNYSVVNHYNNNFLVQGNSGIPEYPDDPDFNFDDNPFNDINYINVEDQYFYNYTSGINDKFNFSFATQFKEIFYFGGSMAFHHIDFYQNTVYEESSNDGNGNTMDVSNVEYLSTYGSGFNFGLGIIVKPVKSLRLGAAYQSPIWYNLSERFEQRRSYVFNGEYDPYPDYPLPNYYDYQLKTPGQFIGSLAYVFGQYGLISFDYTYKGFSNTKLQPSGNFIDENQDLSSGLRNTSSFKFGTEWKYKILSFRGGYRIIQTPYKDLSTDYDIKGYSLGLGIKLTRRFALDFAYDNASYQDQYRFISAAGVNPAQLEITDNRFTSSLVVNF